MPDLFLATVGIINCNAFQYDSELYLIKYLNQLLLSEFSGCFDEFVSSTFDQFVHIP